MQKLSGCFEMEKNKFGQIFLIKKGTDLIYWKGKKYLAVFVIKKNQLGQGFLIKKRNRFDLFERKKKRI